MMDGMNVVLSESASLELTFIEATIKMMLGMMIFMGMFTRISAILSVFAIVAFAFLIGPLSLHLDIGLINLGMAIAFTGAGAWSMDTKMFKKRSVQTKHKDIFLFFVRISVASQIARVSLLLNSLFQEGLWASIAWPVFGLELLLVLVLIIGLAARYIMILVFALFFTGLIIGVLTFFPIEELVLYLTYSIAAGVYILLGPDKVTFFKDFSLSNKST